ncbi:Hypothetical protein ABZS17G119_03650 [Kosakonia cowanii]
MDYTWLTHPQKQRPLRFTPPCQAGQHSAARFVPAQKLVGGLRIFALI